MDNPSCSLPRIAFLLAASLVLMLYHMFILNIATHRVCNTQVSSIRPTLAPSGEHQCQIGNKTFSSLCMPHSHLLNLLGLPEPCQHSILILECYDPCLSYLDDENVYKTCGIDMSDVHGLKSERGNEVRKAYGDDEIVYYKYKTYPELCTKNEILVSKKTVMRYGNTSKKVPNIVHYAWTGCKRKFYFKNYISVLSVDKFIRPEKIYFHGDCLPKGKWWSETISKVPNIYYRHREKPQLIQGRKPMFGVHETDLIRLEVLLEEGGIYLDTDVIVLKPVEDLRDFPLTMGQQDIEGGNALCDAFMLSEPKSRFMCVWFRVFREYHPMGPKDWATYAVAAPSNVYGRLPHPGYIHVDEYLFFRPNFKELDLIYDKFYDWSDNYILHLWTGMNYGKIPQDPTELPLREDVTSTIQEVMRYIYFGDKQIRGSIKIRPGKGDLVPNV